MENHLKNGHNVDHGYLCYIWLSNASDTSGQSYKHFMLVNYDSRVVKWGIFQSGTTQES